MRIVTANEFESVVLNAATPILVDFYADWCGPCRAIAPNVEAVADQVKDIAVVKFDVDSDQGQTAGKHGVRGIPSLILFVGGKAVTSIVGYRATDEIKEAIAQALASK
jgi:thioredoxin 1